MQVLEIGKRRMRRIVSTARRERISRLEDVDVRIDRPCGKRYAGPTRGSDGRQTISDVAGHVSISGLEDVDVRIDRPCGKRYAGPTRGSDGRQTISDVAGHVSLV